MVPWRVLLLLLTVLEISNAFKIAVFAPYICNSQVIFNQRIAEVLADAGHDVKLYVIYPMDHDFKMAKVQANVKVEIVNASAGSSAEAIYDDKGPMSFENLPFWDKRALGGIQMLDEIIGSCDLLLTNKTFMDGVKREKFDVALTHMFSYCNIGIFKLAGIPSWIWVSSGVLLEHMSGAIGAPKPPSYCTPTFMDAGQNLTFYERVKSFIGGVIMRNFFPIVIGNKETEIFRRHFGPEFPSLTDLAKEAPLVFVNSNELYDFACPTLHKVVNIGGLGMKQEDAKPLTGEYATRVNASADGHIVLSFGSVAPVHLMPAHWKDALIHTFEAFPTVQFFVRYDREDLNDRIPKNVMLAKWLPQTDLLQHKKCRGLITHGGYNSVQDAIYAGVPMISIALFGDQFKNGHPVEKLGTGIYLSKEQIGRETMEDAVGRILNDDRYKSVATRLLRQVRSKPVSADQLLVRWTEFVAEFHTLEHLVPFGTKLGFVQYHSLDVIAFLSVVVLMLMGIVLIVIRCAIKYAYHRFLVKEKQA